MAQQVPKRKHRVVKLDSPIEVGSESIDTVYVMRPRAGDMRLYPAPGTAKTVGDYHPFWAKLCGLTVTEFELLEAEDYQRCMEAAEELVSEFPRTGLSASGG